MTGPRPGMTVAQVWLHAASGRAPLLSSTLAPSTPTPAQLGDDPEQITRLIAPYLSIPPSPGAAVPAR